VKIIGGLLMIAAAVYGIINVTNGTYVRAKREGRYIGLVIGAVIVIIAMLARLFR
jgi:hypothetical protein